MKLLMADDNGTPRGGVLLGDSVVALDDLGHPSVLALVEAGPAAWEEVEAASAAARPRWSLRELTLLPPIPRPPRNVFCVGVNYKSHFDEGKRPEGSTVPDAPVLFTKPWTSLVGHDAVVEIDGRATEKADWEAEIVVVIGVGGRNISEHDALRHVFGYTLGNDVSARDLQLEHGMFGQWFKGKSLDGFCPMGPVVVTASELPDPDVIHVRLSVNGETKQDFVASDMVNSIPRIIARLSLGMTLLPGDLVMTGTGAGVGHWRDPKEFLGDGDVVEIESEAIGLLRTQFSERKEDR